LGKSDIGSSQTVIYLLARIMMAVPLSVKNYITFIFSGL